jgi:hypothetical protein
MDSLYQLLDQSQREISAAPRDDSTDDYDHYFIDRGADLLASLRLLAQSRFEDDAAVRTMLTHADGPVLAEASRALEEQGTDDGFTAARLVDGIANTPQPELMGIVVYALKPL